MRAAKMLHFAYGVGVRESFGQGVRAFKVASTDRTLQEALARSRIIKMDNHPHSCS